MDAKDKTKYQTRADILKALAHPTRLFIVDRLVEGEKCVADLTAMVGADMSTVSKHLSLLKAVGFVSDHKRGAKVFYRLRTTCMPDFFKCVEEVLRDNLQTEVWPMK